MLVFFLYTGNRKSKAEFKIEESASYRYYRGTSGQLKGKSPRGWLAQEVSMMKPRFWSGWKPREWLRTETRSAQTNFSV